MEMHTLARKFLNDSFLIDSSGKIVSRTTIELSL